MRGGRVGDQGVKRAGQGVEVGPDCERGFGRRENQDDAAEGPEWGEVDYGLGTVALEGGTDYGEIVRGEDGGVLEVLVVKVLGRMSAGRRQCNVLLEGGYSRVVMAVLELVGLLDQEIMSESGDLWRFGWRIVR